MVGDKEVAEWDTHHSSQLVRLIGAIRRFAIAAIRAGEAGILDLGIWQPDHLRRTSVERLKSHGGRHAWGLRCELLGDLERLDSLFRLLNQANQTAVVPMLVIAGGPATVAYKAFSDQALQLIRQRATHVFAEVCSPEQALIAQESGFDGLILKAHEAGGRVSSTSAFLFLQHLRGKLRIPYWVQGGMGPHTAAAACLAGAAGAVLAEQLCVDARVAARGTRKEPLRAARRRARPFA